MKTYYFFSHTAWILPLSFFYLLFTGVSWASDDNEWIPLSRTEDTPEILGENLANKLVLKFKKEGTNVIFLALPKCVPGPIVSDEWCDNFYSELMTKLSAKNIRFLKENEQKSIREKIANEQAYQQGSLQVDVSKAVSLGKQNAFQAYVSIEVIGSSADKIRTTANSINIEQGAVTITEKAAITIKLENMRSTGTLFFGLTTSIFGFGVGGYGLIEAAKHKDAADKEYLIYKKATTPDDATNSRKKVSTEISQEGLFYGVAGAGLITGIYGIWYMANAKVDTRSYYMLGKYDIAGNHQSTLAQGYRMIDLPRTGRLRCPQPLARRRFGLIHAHTRSYFWPWSRDLSSELRRSRQLSVIYGVFWVEDRIGHKRDQS